MSRINLPKHPLRPESPLMYAGKPVAKMTRREALELIGLIANEQIEEVQSLGLDWHNPHRFSIPMSAWKNYRISGIPVSLEEIISGLADPTPQPAAKPKPTDPTCEI